MLFCYYYFSCEIIYNNCSVIQNNLIVSTVGSTCVNIDRQYHAVLIYLISRYLRILGACYQL